MTLEYILTVWVELCDVPNAFEQQSVAIFTCSLDHFLQLSFSSKHFRISLISSEVNSESNKFFAYDGFRTVDNELINERNAISVSECGFCLIFETKVIEQLNNQSSESRSLKSID
jgi:hypothetical protein